MRITLIDQGRVVNLIEAESIEEAQALYPDLTVRKSADDDAIDALPQVPEQVTMRQARLALLGAGMLSKVDSAIAALPGPMHSAALIEWEYSSAVQRHNGFVAQLGPILGLSDKQLDALFIAAAAL